MVIVNPTAFTITLTAVDSISGAPSITVGSGSQAVVYSDTMWILISNGPVAPAASGAGYLSLGFQSSQNITAGTPTIVQFDTVYETNFPSHPSFITDTANYGFTIVEAGMYSIKYQLLFTNTTLDNDSAPVRYQAAIRWPIAVDGIQNIGPTAVFGTFAVTPGPTISPPNTSVTIASQGVAYLPAGALVQVEVQHNSNGEYEQIIGPYSGFAQAFPDYFPTFFQLVKL